MILVATGIGNAFAYTWAGTDWSDINEGSVWWYDTVDGTPTVSPGSYLTWDNFFYNVGNTSYYPSLFYAHDYGGSDWVRVNHGAICHFQTWWPDTPSYQAESSSGTHYFIVRDYYGYDYAGSDFSVQNDQYYRV